MLGSSELACCSRLGPQPVAVDGEENGAVLESGGGNKLLAVLLLNRAARGKGEVCVEPSTMQMVVLRV